MRPQLFLGNEPKRELIQPIKNDNWIKPRGGLWTSTFENGRSDWVEWCESEQFFTTDSRVGWLLIPNKNINIYTIDNYNDLENLYSKYGVDLNTRYPYLNFELMSKEYDGIHLTSNGQTSTRYTEPYHLNAWDVESTNWFRWCFDEVSCIGQIEIEEYAY